MKHLLAALAVVCFFSPSDARAQSQPSGTIDLSSSIYGFSPGDVYGPWDIQTLEARIQAGSRDKPGFSITNRSDHDGPNVTHSAAFAIDDYHDWSPKFFTYASIGASVGSILPRSQYYLEADPKIGDRLIVGAGYGVYNEPDGLHQHYLNIGPTLYFPGGNATVRYIPMWTTGQVSAPSYTANLSLGTEGRTVTSFTYQGGVEPQFAINDPSVSNRFANTTTVFDFEVRHWINPRVGYHIGGGVASQTDRQTGAKVYDRRGIRFGLFFGIGHQGVQP